MRNYYIKRIAELVKNNPDDEIYGMKYLHVLDNEHNYVKQDDVEIVEIHLDGENVLTFRCYDTSKHETSYLAGVEEFSDETLIALYEATDYTIHYDRYEREVRAKIKRITDEAVGRLHQYIEAAFTQNAFDMFQAYENGYLIPKAIVTSAAMALAKELTEYSVENAEEANKIFEKI